MKTRTAALGLSTITLVALVAGLSFFSSQEEGGRRAALAVVGSTAGAAPGRGPGSSPGHGPVAAGRSSTAAGATPAATRAPGASRSDAATTSAGDPRAAASSARGRRPVGPRPAPGPKRALTGQQVSRLRTSLTSAAPEERLAAVRYLRAVETKELLPDLRALLQTETVTPVRRVASQLLAQADPRLSLAELTRLRDDPDAVVRINAAYGLARAGDASQQAWLLGVYDAARIASPRLVPVIAAALEDPAMKSPAVVARFQAIADDDRQDPALRAKAAKVLRAKLGA